VKLEFVVIADLRYEPKGYFLIAGLSLVGYELKGLVGQLFESSFVESGLGGMGWFAYGFRYFSGSCGVLVLFFDHGLFSGGEGE
jgi:hypothetical protein